MRVRHSAAALALVATLPLASCRKAENLPPAGVLVLDTSWVVRAVIYEVFVQDFSPSGDFRGVTDGLDRIQRAGADVVWLMPIHPLGVRNRKEPLGSPYAVRDYRAINPAYGSAADFRALVDAVHQRGMKLIIDWVPDHTAWDHAWITEHPDWYVKDDSGRISVPRDAQGNLTNWTDVAQLDYHNAALRQEMIATMRWWLTEFGLDGYRVDVAGFVPNDFWRDALPQLRGAVTKPILLLAEWGDPGMHGVGFDLTYGWDGYSRLKAVWDSVPADSFTLFVARDTMPNGGMRLRFTTNHDETAWDNPPVLRFRSPAGARAAFAAMALLPGRPMLYNGQEVESPQQLGLFRREAIAWERPGAEQARDFYRRILDLAHTHPAIIGRSYRPLTTGLRADVIAYQRGGVVVLVNARDRLARFTVDSVAVAGARDLLSGRIQPGARVTLPPYGAVVLELRAGTQ